MSDDRGYAPDFVSAETLAYRLDCSRATIDAYVRRGYLPRPTTIGNLVRWDFRKVVVHIQASNGQLEAEQEDDFLKALGNGSNQTGEA